MQIKKKKKAERTECCFLSLCANVGSLFSVTQELIKLDSLWMLSLSCCLCKQLGETDHFNGRLWLQLIRYPRSANSLFHCFLLWFHFHSDTFLTTWQLNHFLSPRSLQLAHSEGNSVVASFNPPLCAYSFVLYLVWELPKLQICSCSGPPWCHTRFRASYAVLTNLGRRWDSCMLFADLPPMILTAAMEDYSAVEGKGVMMHCKVFSSPPSTIIW